LRYTRVRAMRRVWTFSRRPARFGDDRVTCVCGRARAGAPVCVTWGAVPLAGS
jgi:hypothetical protein